MSRLNPNAGAFVPSFAVPAPPAVTPVATPALETKPAKATPTAKAASPAPAVDAAHDDVAMEATNDRLVYSMEYLLQFQPICDTVPCYFPDVVRAPAPQRLGRYINDRLVYTVPELLLFQPLYQMFPPDLEWSETLAIVADSVDKKAKAPAKLSKKEKAKAKAAAAAAASSTDQLQYDPTLMCYFNPTEYAAALSMAAYGSATPTTEKGGTAAGVTPNGKAIVDVVNPVEEAVVAKRRLATLLDDLQPESVASILKSFEEITITCTHTLQELIAQLFDRAIAEPKMCDTYAQLCTGMAERTPEFKEGAKTINFRRILLTRCYEALIEEPEAVGDAVPSVVKSATVNGSTAENGMAQHSWRRQCMLQNVCFVGELFRRQLLTENVMHVCVAMMLEDEINPQVEVIDAACRLLMLVGDLLDGSSPASRRTMDEYFDVLQRLASRPAAEESLKERIAEMASIRAGGWAKKRVESSASSGSPNKPTSAAPVPSQIARATPVVVNFSEAASSVSTVTEANGSNGSTATS